MPPVAMRPVRLIPRLIRSVRISMTLADPDGKAADQNYSVVAALRNRLLKGAIMKKQMAWRYSSV